MRNMAYKWDFFSHLPESLHQLTIDMSDRGFTFKLSLLFMVLVAILIALSIKIMNVSGLNSISVANKASRT